MTKREARALLVEWKERLQLKDWEIGMVFCSPRELPDKMADNTIVSERRDAKIRLLWPHLDPRGEPDDVEHTLVHELVHCWFDSFYPGNPARSKHKVLVIENAVDAIAKALVEAKRQRD